MRVSNNNVSWQGVTPAQRMQMQQAQQQERLQQAGNDILGGGGFILFLIFTPIYLGKWSDLTNNFSDGLKPPTSINNSMWAGNESKTLAKLTYSRGNSTIMQPLQKVVLMTILYEWKTIPRSIIHWLMINIWRQTSACWKHISIVFSWAPWGSPEYQRFEVSWFMDARQLFVESVLCNS